jgi:hypothetical protein
MTQLKLTPRLQLDMGVTSASGMAGFMLLLIVINLGGPVSSLVSLIRDFAVIQMIKLHVGQLGLETTRQVVGQLGGPHQNSFYLKKKIYLWQLAPGKKMCA